MKIINKNQVSNILKPYYFIFKNEISFLTKDAELIDILHFKDAFEAKRYCKKFGYFYEYINGLSCSKIMDKIIIK